MGEPKKVLGMDIGGTNLRAGLVDEAGEMQAFVVHSSKELFGGGQSPTDVLRDFVLGYCATHLGGEMPYAVSIGFPATVNKARDTVLSTPNLAHFNNVNVVAPLREALGIPVFINKDVYLLLRNDIQECGLGGTVIGCYYGTGLGSAIFINGVEFEGKNGVAGELGHIPMLGETGLCGCGNTGCAETVASGCRLTALNDALFPGQAIGDIFINHANHPEVRAFVEILAIPVATDINILDPDHVVLGGGVLQMAGFPYEQLTAAIHKFCRKPYPAETLHLVRSPAKQESGVKGAALYAFIQCEK